MKNDNEIQHGNNFEMYRNIVSLCCVPGINIELQVNYTSKISKQTNSQKKRSEEAGVWGGELDEGSQKVQTSSYKMNNY